MIKDLIEKVIQQWREGKLTDHELGLQIIQIHNTHCLGCITCFDPEDQDQVPPEIR